MTRNKRCVAILGPYSLLKVMRQDLTVERATKRVKAMTKNEFECKLLVEMNANRSVVSLTMSFGTK